MGIDVNKLLAETKTLLAIGQEEWNKPGIGTGVTQDLVTDWINQHMDFLVSTYKFQFLQKLYSTAFTGADSITLTYNQLATPTLTDIHIDDKILAVEKGTIGSTPASIQIVPLSDLQEYVNTYTDTNQTVYAYWTLDALNAQRILRFNTAQGSNGTINLACFVYPGSITAFPNDFHLLFKYKVVAEGLLLKQSANLDDSYSKYTQLARMMEDKLAKKYAASSRYDFKVVTPHQNLNYNTWMKGRAR